MASALVSTVSPAQLVTPKVTHHASRPEAAGYAPQMPSASMALALPDFAPVKTDTRARTAHKPVSFVSNLT